MTNRETNTQIKGRIKEELRENKKREWEKGNRSKKVKREEMTKRKTEQFRIKVY